MRTWPANMCLMSCAALVAAVTSPITAQNPGNTIRVACVGDSITYGARLEDREQHSYPAQLQKLLGDDVAVFNFGVGGCTGMACQKVRVKVKATGQESVAGTALRARQFAPSLG